MSTPSACLDLVDAVLERHDRALVLLDLVVDVTLERAHDRGEAVVQLGGVADAAGDDQRRARLVDQDRVDLVDDAVAVAALDLGVEPRRHVVAEVVEAHLVVGAVGDVALVVAALLLRPVLEAGDDESDAEPEELVDLAHPLGVAAGEVVVDGDQVDAFAAQPVEVGRQRGDEGLALTGLHFGDPAEVERGAAHQLHVVVALADHAHGGLAGDGECLDQDVVEGRAVGEPISELDRLASQFVVGQAMHLVAERVDVGNDRLEGLDLLAFSRAEDAIENAHAADQPTGGRS